MENWQKIKRKWKTLHTEEKYALLLSQSGRREWWRRTAILITQCLGLRWGGCVTLQGICDSKWWTNDIWSGFRMWACWKQKLRVLGKTNGKVNYKRQEKTLPIIAVKDTGPNFLEGGGWGMWNWTGLKKQLAHDPHSLSKEQVHTATLSQPLTLNQVLQKHEGVFKEELGTLTGFEADTEFDWLLREHIIMPGKQSEWAAPEVSLLNPDGNCRLCGDYKWVVNRVSNLIRYLIPKVEDLLAVLASNSQNWTCVIHINKSKWMISLRSI